MKDSTLNGYKIEHNGTEWVFSDNGESTVATYKERPCGYCNKHSINEGFESYDACIGKVDGLINACCGHGDASSAYAQINKNTILIGEDAVKYFEDNR